MVSSRSLKKCLLAILELRKCNGQFIRKKHLRNEIKEREERRKEKKKKEKENDNSLEKRPVNLN